MSDPIVPPTGQEPTVPPTGGAPKSNKPAPAGNYRWIICALLFFSVAVNYIDRLVIGILKNPLSEALGWTEMHYGYIAAAFQFAYAFGYLFGGRLMDKWGVKKGLPIFVSVWSAAAMAHGLCTFLDKTAEFRVSLPWFSWAEGGFIIATLAMPMTAAGFMFARILLGLSEGGNFPGAIRAVAEWFPIKERALATGIFNAGTNVGAVICPVAVPWIFGHMGWEATFYITGGVGFLWLIGWLLVYDNPETHKRLSEGERAYIREGKPAVETVPPRVPWLSLLGYRAVWAYILARVLCDPAWGFYQFFIPDFLTKKFGLPLEEIGYWTGGFYIIAAVGGVAGGWLAGKLMSRGWTLNSARKMSLFICALFVVPVFLAPYAETVFLAVLIAGIAGSAHQGTSANLYSLVSDTMPKNTISSVVGLGGFVGSMMGGVVAALTGWIVQTTGSYVPVFAGISSVYLVALLLVHILVPRIGQSNKA